MIGYAFCGSFCTFADSFAELSRLVDSGRDIIPIMSENAYSTDTRFFAARDFIRAVEEKTGKAVVHTITEAEKFGQRRLDSLIISPCTGNTLAKIAHGITDTTVTMCVKAQLRCRRPVIIALATNDGLGANLSSIALTLEKKNIFFVPFGQDSPFEKPSSLICDFSLIPLTLEQALLGKQLQPILL